MDLELADKSVIVTGAASNIGRAIALGFAAEGARITIADLDETLAYQVAQTASDRGAAEVQVIKTDVTDAAAVKKMVDSAQQFGGVHALVNAVGWDQLMFFTDTDAGFWEKIIRINYLSVLNLTHALLPTMIDQGEGSFVCISSDASRQGEPREAVYGGTKAAVNSFMKTIAKENGRFGIRCNLVCPGVTLPDPEEAVSDNSMWARRDAMFTEDQLEKVAKAMPLKKIGKPQDIANAAVFLSSRAVAGHITGQVLSVSGGYSMVG
ncbi:MAG: SDR family oxidoreductase [Gammaproteobacteria bacterium]